MTARLEHERRVIHIEGSIISRAVGSPDGTEDGFDFRECAKDSILFLEQLRRLPDGDPGQGCRHVESRTFIEGRHELTSNMERERKCDDQKNQIEQQGGFAEPQAQSQNRQINSLGDSGNGIPRFRYQSPTYEQDHEHWDKRDRQDGGEANRQRLRPRQRAKHASFLCFQ